MSIPSFATVICAAGSSDRFNQGQSEHYKKEFLSIDGHSMLYRALSPFFSLGPALKAVAISINEGLEQKTLYALEDLGIQSDVPIILVKGGSIRQASVRNALEDLDKSGISFDFVMIHDGDRPYVTAGLVAQTLAMASLAGAAAPALGVVDALKTIDENGFIEDHRSRAGLFRIQTPQAFGFKDILKAHRLASEENAAYLDDTQIYQQFIGKVATVQGLSLNRKITFAEDLQ